MVKRIIILQSFPTFDLVHCSLQLSSRQVNLICVMKAGTCVVSSILGKGKGKFISPTFFRSSQNPRATLVDYMPVISANQMTQSGVYSEGSSIMKHTLQQYEKLCVMSKKRKLIKTLEVHVNLVLHCFDTYWYQRMCFSLIECYARSFTQNQPSF